MSGHPRTLPVPTPSLPTRPSSDLKPQAFHSIVVAIPSLELDGGVRRDEHAFVARREGGKIGRTSRLMIVVGDRDVDDDPEPARALADRFDRLSGLGLR